MAIVLLLKCAHASFQFDIMHNEGNYIPNPRIRKGQYDILSITPPYKKVKYWLKITMEEVKKPYEWHHNKYLTGQFYITCDG